MRGTTVLTVLSQIFKEKKVLSAFPVWTTNHYIRIFDLIADSVKFVAFGHLVRVDNEKIETGDFVDRSLSPRKLSSTSSKAGSATLTARSKCAVNVYVSHRWRRWTNGQHVLAHTSSLIQTRELCYSYTGVKRMHRSTDATRLPKLDQAIQRDFTSNCC